MNQTLINTALLFAAKHFNESCHNTGKPVYLHSLRVAQHAHALGCDEFTIVCAILHDLLEDTDCTAGEIAAELGVADLASAISSGTVQFAAFNSSGNITTSFTANSGYWFGSNGAAVSWGSSAYIALEPANGNYITGNLFQYHCAACKL